MNARFDPASAPTPADRAYDRALSAREERASINAAETHRAAVMMVTRHRPNGVGWSRYWLQNVAAHNERKGTNITPLEYLAECLQETADDAFEQLPSPEDAADDEPFREGDARGERDE
ncbi:MAG: hypothetical protein KAH44_29025 [Oricola sp.]|jgi:hypothetical protein|nr:hypothetical protein [Oricola sp.]